MFFVMLAGGMWPAPSAGEVYHRTEGPGVVVYAPPALHVAAGEVVLLYPALAKDLSRRFAWPLTGTVTVWLLNDEALFQHFRKMQQEGECLTAFVAPRGIGPTAWNQSEKKQTQIRRRFMLLGQTLDGMRVWDVRRAIQAVRSLDAAKDVPLILQGERQAGGIALYASLFEPDIQRLDLRDLSRTHRDGPILLNVRRYLDIPQTVAMVLERSEIVIYQSGEEGWDYPKSVAHVLDWGEERLSILEPPQGE